MDISYFGHSFFRIRGKTAVLVTDPFDEKMVGFKYPRINADIVTISHDHKDHNCLDKITDIKRVVDGPGEYEILGVSIVGINSFHDDKKGEKRGKNTIFVIEIDGLRLAHLGDLGHKLSSRVLEEMGNIDILMLPVGGEYTIGPSTASEVVRSIEPTMIIPMHYQAQGLKKDVFGKLEKVNSFLTDIGLTVERVQKLTVRKETIGEDQKVIVLENSSK